MITSKRGIFEVVGVLIEKKERFDSKDKEKKIRKDSNRC